jgi:DNA-binding NarL/FixJ family response regulator
MTIELKPDVILLDVNTPAFKGLEAARRIRRLGATPMVFVTADNVAELESSANELGRIAIVTETTPPATLVATIRQLLFPGEPATASLHANRRRTTASLTPREREVLLLVAEGYTTKQVAARLGISAKTAATHRTNIIGKLKFKSLTDLVRYAIRHGLISA